MANQHNTFSPQKGQPWSRRHFLATSMAALATLASSPAGRHSPPAPAPRATTINTWIRRIDCTIDALTRLRQFLAAALSTPADGERLLTLELDARSAMTDLSAAIEQQTIDQLYQAATGEKQYFWHLCQEIRRGDAAGLEPEIMMMCPASAARLYHLLQGVS